MRRMSDLSRDFVIELELGGWLCLWWSVVELCVVARLMCIDKPVSQKAGRSPSGFLVAINRAESR